MNRKRDLDFPLAEDGIRSLRNSCAYFMIPTYFGIGRYINKSGRMDYLSFRSSVEDLGGLVSG